MFDVLLRLLLFLASAGSAFAAVRYVDANSTSPSPPYLDWSTAATTIQAAVDDAAAGDEIVVTNGTYATGGRAVGPEFMTNRVTVDKPLRLRSVNGPQFTIIQGAKAPGGGNGEGAIRCVHLASGASLSGFTLTNGATRTAGATDLNQSGGGVWCGSTNAALTNCVLAGNSAQHAGGGARHGTLYNCTLSGNSAWWGGGVQWGTLHNCVLTGNSAKFQGGGASIGILHNCVLTGNSANSGGGVSGGTLVNCTVTGNSAESGGGADVYWEYGHYKCSLRNCIVYFNRAPKGANYSKETTFDYSCTTPLAPGPGNIAADPQLANATHLSPNSPCIGAGNPAYAQGVDIDGEPWASPPTMGADQPGPATGPLSLGIDADFTNVATGYAVSFTARNTGHILSSVWDFGDGTVLTNQPFASHTWEASGLYTVRLTGYNDTYPAGVTTTAVVTVIEAVHYVNQAGSNPVFPYASWETAARNIQEAIGAGTLPGRSVLVTNGAYRLETVEANGQNRVALTNRVVLRSVNGPVVTVIEGATNGVRCAYVGNGSVLSGFTLTKGTTTRDAGDDLRAHGGGVWCESFGVVTHCVLTGNSAVGQGGGVSGGSLYRCTLTGNSAYYGGGADRGTLHNCTLSGNSAEASGGGAEGATLYSCTLTGNSAVSGGGAVWSTLKNCIVYSNQARAQKNEANHS